MNFSFICSLHILVDGNHSFQCSGQRLQSYFVSSLSILSHIQSSRISIRFTCKIYLEFGDFMPPTLRPPWSKLPSSCFWKLYKMCPCFIRQSLLRSQIYTYETSVRSCYPFIQTPQCFFLKFTIKAKVLAITHQTLKNLPGQSPASLLPTYLVLFLKHTRHLLKF